MNRVSILVPIKNFQNVATPSSDSYASVADSAALLGAGDKFRRDRMEAADMISTDEAASLLGVGRCRVNAWVESQRCIGISNPDDGYRLPRWQFEHQMWPMLQLVASALGAADGWQVLAFLEAPARGLGGHTPRSAIEQGVPVQRILAIAAAESH
ncbi:hypothetical protein DBR12_06125 [Acidovorax sp. HMWF029]|nr:hypothetical protein DBR12_06125 [Acidovorax sp. HMWF029]